MSRTSKILSSFENETKPNTNLNCRGPDKNRTCASRMKRYHR